MTTLWLVSASQCPAGDAGKVLNSYYEDVYIHLPSIF